MLDTPLEAGFVHISITGYAQFLILISLLAYKIETSTNVSAKLLMQP